MIGECETRSQDVAHVVAAGEKAHKTLREVCALPHKHEAKYHSPLVLSGTDVEMTDMMCAVVLGNIYRARRFLPHPDVVDVMPRSGTGANFLVAAAEAILEWVVRRVPNHGIQGEGVRADVLMEIRSQISSIWRSVSGQQRAADMRRRISLSEENKALKRQNSALELSVAQMVRGTVAVGPLAPTTPVVPVTRAGRPTKPKAGANKKRGGANGKRPREEVAGDSDRSDSDLAM